MKRVIAAIVLLGTCGYAHADPSIRVVLSEYSKGNVAAIAYLRGISAGLGWANALIAQSGERPIYCQPDKLALTDEQRLDILNRFLAEYPRVAEQQVGVVLMAALKDAFPCPK
jgi:hypothetical protein